MGIQSDPANEEPLIRLDKLPREIAPSYDSVHPTAALVRRWVGLLGSPTGGHDAITTSPDTVYKFRIYNSGFVTFLCAIPFLIGCGGASIAIALGGHLAGWVFAPIAFLAAAWLIRDLPKSDCVIVTPKDVIVKGHLLAQRIPISDITSTKIRDGGLGSGRQLQIVLHTTIHGLVRTPLEASRMAGQEVIDEVLRHLDEALSSRRMTQ